MKDKKKERKLGVILGYLNYIIKIIVQLLYVPVMLKYLGNSEYGTYQMVSSLIAYLGLLSFGFDGAYLKFYSSCKEDKEKESSLNGTYLIIFTFFGLLALIIGFIFFNKSEVILGTKLSKDELALAKKLLLLLSFNMSITFPSSVFSSIVTSRESFLFQRTIEITKNIFNPFLSTLMLLCGKGSIGIVAITTLLTISSSLINVWYIFVKLKVRFSFKSLNIPLIKEISIFSFFIFLGSIVDQINWNVDKFLLGRLCGTISVSIYSIASQINMVFIQLSDMTANVMSVKVNKIVAENIDVNSKLNMIFIEVGRIQACIVSMIVFGFIALGKEFIELWVGYDYIGAYYATLFLIIPASIPLIQSLGIDIQRALNKHQIRSLLYMAFSIINIIVSISLINNFNYIGAAIGTGIVVFIGNGLLMNVLYHRYIGLNIIDFWKNVLPIVVTAIVPCLLTMSTYYIFDNINLYCFIFRGTLFVIVYLLLLQKIILSKEEKLEIISIFNKNE